MLGSAQKPGTLDYSSWDTACPPNEEPQGSLRIGPKVIYGLMLTQTVSWAFDVDCGDLDKEPAVPSSQPHP